MATVRCGPPESRCGSRNWTLTRPSLAGLGRRRDRSARRTSANKRCRISAAIPATNCQLVVPGTPQGRYCLGGRLMSHFRSTVRGLPKDHAVAASLCAAYPARSKPLAGATSQAPVLLRVCHSNATRPKEVLGFMFEKLLQPGAPLRNRTVDLLLTMDHQTVPCKRRRGSEQAEH